MLLALTGLQTLADRSVYFDSAQERYAKLARNATSFAVPQFGLATFRYLTEERKYGPARGPSLTHSLYLREDVPSSVVMDAGTSARRSTCTCTRTRARPTSTASSASRARSTFWCSTTLTSTNGSAKVVWPKECRMCAGRLVLTAPRRRALLAGHLRRRELHVAR